MTKRSAQSLARDDNGQVIVEYILMLFLVVGTVALLATIFRRSIVGLWRVFAKEIAAACPKCPSTL